MFGTPVQKSQNATVIDLWDVDNAPRIDRPFSANDVASHLLADWSPWLVSASGSSFMGWPNYVLESSPFKPARLLLSKDVAGSERQWKAVLSWMLGVAGARHFLSLDGYRWVAPISAFYPEAAQRVTTQKWDDRFPECTIRASKKLTSGVRLAPDYLALRSTSTMDNSQPKDRMEWAVVEAKGTPLVVATLETCPVDWSKQSKNIDIFINGSQENIPRHLVVATRVNQKAKRPDPRRVQIRAWNNQAEEVAKPTSAIPNIVSAHLFGLLRNLAMVESARAISYGVRVRSGHLDRHLIDLGGAFSELDARQHRFLPIFGENSERGKAYVRFSEPLVGLIKALAEDSTEEAAINSVRKYDARLDEWWSGADGNVALSYGIELAFSHSDR